MNGDGTSGLRIKVLVVSDSSAHNERKDLSGPFVAAWVCERGVEAIPPVEIVPDEVDQITAKLKLWLEAGETDLILTCGGTGVTPRDVTPEATSEIIERELPGFGEAMRAASLKKTPHAIISRAVAGLCGDVLIINLPGSLRAAVENLGAVWPAVGHTVAKAKGDPEPCGG